YLPAEDGIRDDLVTGVQTCALPISIGGTIWGVGQALLEQTGTDAALGRFMNRNFSGYLVAANADIPELDILFVGDFDEEASPLRSEERRVGKEWDTRDALSEEETTT